MSNTVLHQLQLRNAMAAALREENNPQPLSSTDNKIYLLVVTGRLLEGCAFMAATAVFSYSLVVTPFAAFWLIPAVAFWVIGARIVQNFDPESVAIANAQSRIFVPGQPVGLQAGGNNCWLNSALQLLVHVPAFEERLRQIPIFAEFLNAYKNARAGSELTASGVSPQKIREFLSRETGAVISPAQAMEDPVVVFDYLFQGAGAGNQPGGNNCLYQLETQIRDFVVPFSTLESESDPEFVNQIFAAYEQLPQSEGTVGNFIFKKGCVLEEVHQCPSKYEPMIHIEMDVDSKVRDFDSLMEYYFKFTDSGMQRHFRFFPEAPKDLLVQVKRFSTNALSGAPEKISDRIDVRETYHLPSEFNLSQKGADYHCDAFLVHSGTLETGHHVAYVKVADRWWYCSDASVVAVSTEQARIAMQECHILHFAMDPPVLISPSKS
jgi:hypothetical protein